MDHLNLEACRTFLFIVELNGFNKAAEKTHRTQSAISMQMKKLEEVAGKPLFEKKGKKYLLTNHGEVLLSYAKKMLDLNDEFFMISKEAKLKGTIKIGLHLDFAESELPKALYRFNKSHPEITLELKIEPSDVLQQDLANGKLDMIIYLTNESNPELNSIRIGSFPMKWIYAPSHSSLVKNRLQPLALAVLGPNCRMRQLASLSLNNAEITWRISFSSSNLSAIWGAVNAGIGISARTEIGLPPSLAPIPNSFGLPKLPTVHAYLCTDNCEQSKAVITLKSFLLTAAREKRLLN
jgi:DNA-binding transcriptional LysR family regulator